MSVLFLAPPSSYWKFQIKKNDKINKNLKKKVKSFTLNKIMQDFLSDFLLLCI